jgi:hypothetical protein
MDHKMFSTYVSNGHTAAIKTDKILLEESNEGVTSLEPLGWRVCRVSFSQGLQDEMSEAAELNGCLLLRRNEHQERN